MARGFSLRGSPRLRFSFALALISTLLLPSMEASAQSLPRSRPAAPPVEKQPEPERKLPDPRHQSRLDQLFERLEAAGDDKEAAAIAEQIQRIWRRSGSDTLDLLIERVQTANAGRDPVTALDILDTILALKPDWAEAYNRRAAIHMQMKDLDAAMRDFQRVLALEPRHFQAMAGVGQALQQNGEPKKALAAFRNALKLNPNFKGIREAVERLSVEHDDQKI
jgi:tetratricopeptide (TPR) repeat protein